MDDSGLHETSDRTPGCLLMPPEKAQSVPQLQSVPQMPVETAGASEEWSLPGFHPTSPTSISHCWALITSRSLIAWESGQRSF